MARPCHNSWHIYCLILPSITTKLGRENDKERILAYNIGLSIHDMNYASHIYGMIKENEGIKDFDVREPKEKFWI